MADERPNGGRRGLGPQYTGDKPFTKRMRLHQSWYRDEVLKVPYGTGPRPSDTAYYGNMLTKESADAGLNFLTHSIFGLVKQRLAESSGTVEPFRLQRNMLSSQPMCFNLFGELALDLPLATRLARVLWGAHIVRVTDVCFEWAPQPRAEYLDDRTAFDAFIGYETADAQAGFVGIETKLTEPFSQKYYRKDKPEYRRWWKMPNSPWGGENASNDIDEKKHNQLWRDHLLAWSLLRHPKSKYKEGRLAVVYHPEDHDCSRVIRGYRELLRNDATFSAFTLADVVRAWKPLMGERGVLSQFELRYLDLDQSEGAR